MSTITRVHTSNLGRRFTRAATLVAVTCVVLLAFASSAFAVNVKLRVETGSSTLFNGTVNTGPRSVALTGPGCVANGSAASVASANAVTAAADWADQAQTTALTGSGGAFLCGLGGYIGDASEYWLMKINNKAQDPPGTYLDGTTPLAEHDSVLWYFTDDYAKPTLDLSLPDQAQAGLAVSGKVVKWDGADDSKTDAAGAVVSGGGATTTAGGDGSFSITFGTVGTQLVSATLPGNVRASAVVTVGTVPVPAAPTPKVRVNRFKKCSATYRKGSRRHRRCIRIVRAKQAAEKRRAASNGHA